MSRIAYYGASVGGYGLIIPAVETRYRTVILWGGGIWKDDLQFIPEANPINFAPYIRGPKLMIQGRYDEGISLKTAAMPLFELLSEPKELIVLESGHFPPMEQWVPPALEWLDETLGPATPSTDAAREAARQEL